MRWKRSPLLWLIAGGLATWRLTSILHEEAIAAPVRKAIGIYETDEEQPFWIYPDNFIGKLFYCFWCLSVWSGGIITILVLIFPPLILPLTFSALAIMVKRSLEKDQWIEEVIEDDSTDGK